MSTQTVSKQTQKNWGIDIALITSAVVAILTGVYFLFLPSNGYQGGRNPMYNFQFLFARETWDDLHTWGGIAMIIAATVHLVIHWSWVIKMVRHTWKRLTGQCGQMNARGRFNLILNVVVAASFILTAISGVYFLFVPGGRWAIDPQFLFTRSTWDMIHTWAGVILTIAAIIHFAIHWKWVTKVTRKIMDRKISSQSIDQPVSVATS
ncbi:MAG: DUF4405 domain-containing protein [Anaerolineaceae bacterium]